MNPEPKKSNPFGWPFWLLLFGIILILYSFVPIRWVSLREVANKKEAIYDTKQIGLSLLDFEDQYGSFPSKDTLALIEEEHPNHGLDLTGDSSNALLRQLYVETGSSPEMLKKGKFHYAYISDLSSPSHPSRPILFGPVIPGTKRIDLKSFGRKAVVLRVDNSASVLIINKEGHIIDKDGDILSPKHPFWNGKAPDIRYPE